MMLNSYILGGFMLIINKSKPFYLNKMQKNLRMGNFASSGKELYYDREDLLLIFDNVKTPISREKLVELISHSSNSTVEEIETAIDYLIQENFIINYEKYNNLINDNKYNRQNLFFTLFNKEYNNYSKCFLNKNILILGLGGIGANTCMMLYKAGFNRFTLVDCDKVEESNLIRQFPYDVNDIGKDKTECLKEKLLDVDIKIKNIKINNYSDISDEIKNADFVLCTIDKPLRVIRRLINRICVDYKKPVLFCGFSEHVGMIGPFVVPNESACLKCIEKNVKEVPLNNVDLVPSYGPLCFMISSIVCNEIINFYVKFNDFNLIGKTLMFDFATYKSKIVKWKRKNNCEVCKHASN